MFEETDYPKLFAELSRYIQDVCKRGDLPGLFVFYRTAKDAFFNQNIETTINIYTAAGSGMIVITPREKSFETIMPIDINLVSALKSILENQAQADAEFISRSKWIS